MVNKRNKPEPAPKVHDFRSYKLYLTDLEAQKAFVQKGFRTRLAEAAGCKTAFISHVLNGDAHFSHEQAYRISSLLGHSMDETSFFLLLLQFERAGTPELRSYYKKQIDANTENRQELKNRLKVKDQLTLEDKARYYSSWEYSAVHVLTTVSNYQRADMIAKRLRLTEVRVLQILGHLQDMGLVKQQGGSYQVTNARIHLGSDSALISQHHTNWRVRSLTSIAEAAPTDLHYSSAITISRADAERLREMILDFITRATPVINDSPEEDIFSLCLDFFRL